MSFGPTPRPAQHQSTGRLTVEPTRAYAPSAVVTSPWRPTFGQLHYGTLSCVTVLVNALLVPVQASAPTQQAQVPVAQAPAVQTPAAVQQATQSESVAEPLLRVEDGRLTLKVTNRPLGWILDQLSQHASVAIVTGDGVGAELITIELRDIPVDEAVRRILHKHDAFFFYRADPEAGPSSVLQVVWVYQKGHGVGLEPVPPEKWASTKDLKSTALSSTDTESRMKAIVALIERGGKEARELALKVITGDKDESIRANALFAARQSGIEIPSTVLVSLFTLDPSPDVRFLALDALAGDPDNARSAAERGLNDPDPRVQSAAEDILKRLDAADPAPPGLVDGR